MITEDEIVDRIGKSYNSISELYPDLSEHEVMNRSHQLVQLGLMVNISNNIEQLNNNLIELGNIMLVANNTSLDKYKKIFGKG